MPTSRWMLACSGSQKNLDFLSISLYIRPCKSEIFLWCVIGPLPEVELEKLTYLL